MIHISYIISKNMNYWIKITLTSTESEIYKKNCSEFLFRNHSDLWAVLWSETHDVNEMSQFFRHPFSAILQIRTNWQWIWTTTTEINRRVTQRNSWNNKNFIIKLIIILFYDHSKKSTIGFEMSIFLEQILDFTENLNNRKWSMPIFL